MKTEKTASAFLHVPSPLRPYTSGERTLRVVGPSVGEALADAVRQFPALEAHLFDDDRKLRSFVNIYLNDEDIRYLERTETKLGPDDELFIVPSIAGGAPSTDAQLTSTLEREPVATATPDVELTPAELRRYNRHLILPEVGLEGQKKLKSASVLLVGAGGLGSPLALYLAAAGVGRLGLVDFDVVDESNLQRQVLHGTSDVGRSKLYSAADRIRDVNPFVDLELHNVRLTSEDALDLIGAYDIVADGTDNFPTRYLVNDACVIAGKPNVYASIFRFDGQVSVFAMPGGPCYRCLYPNPPPPGLVPSCAEGGVLGILPGLVGTLQATEVVKLILGVGDPLVGKLVLVDALSTTFRKLTVRKNDECPVCGSHPSITSLIDYEAFCGIPSASIETVESSVPEISVVELSTLQAQESAPFLLDVRRPFEAAIADIGADQLIPVEELAGRLEEVRARRDERIIVHCRTGVRSARAVSLMREAGFTNVANLRGGIKAWSEEIDPAVPSY